MDRAGQRGKSVGVTIERRVPRIMLISSFPGDYGIIVNATQGGYPLPANLGIPGGAPANRLGLDPVLMASANSAGGVMGKMISLQSIAVAAAATGLKTEDEAKLFRFTLRHSVFLASVIGLVTVFYAYWS